MLIISWYWLYSSHVYLGKTNILEEKPRSYVSPHKVADLVHLPCLLKRSKRDVSVKLGTEMITFASSYYLNDKWQVLLGDPVSTTFTKIAYIMGRMSLLATLRKEQRSSGTVQFIFLLGDCWKHTPKITPGLQSQKDQGCNPVHNYLRVTTPWGQ